MKHEIKADAGDWYYLYFLFISFKNETTIESWIYISIVYLTSMWLSNKIQWNKMYLKCIIWKSLREEFKIEKNNDRDLNKKFTVPVSSKIFPNFLCCTYEQRK